MRRSVYIYDGAHVAKADADMKRLLAITGECTARVITSNLRGAMMVLLTYAEIITPDDPQHWTPNIHAVVNAARQLGVPVTGLTRHLHHIQRPTSPAALPSQQAGVGRNASAQ